MDTLGDGASTTVLQVAGFLNSFMSELHNFKYYLSFIFLTSLTLFLVYIIQKIRRSLTNKDSLIVILLTLFGCFMVVYVIIIGGGKLSGLWTQGTKNIVNNEHTVQISLIEQNRIGGVMGRSCLCISVSQAS